MAQKVEEITTQSQDSDIIEVRDLFVTYSDGTRAIEGISFKVRKGEFFGFLGPNGAGKSTTIKVLTTLLKKTSGSVTVAGHDVEREAQQIRKVIGVQSLARTERAQSQRYRLV